MAVQKMHVVVQKMASRGAKNCDKLKDLGVNKRALAMADQITQDESITELADKLKDHDRRIAELKHELD
jgi:hypothetical protein